MAADKSTCTKCRLPIWSYPVHHARPDLGVAWAVEGTGTTADGLSYCPPDPDHLGELGDHEPKPDAANGATQ